MPKDKEEEVDQQEEEETTEATESPKKTKAKGKKSKATAKKAAAKPKEKKEKKESSSEESPKKRKYADKDLELKKFAPLKKKREHKKVERFTESDEKKKEKKEVVIVKGKGKKFEDCENIVKQLDKLKKDDDLVRNLYGLVYGRPLKNAPIKKHLMAFSGVVYEDEETGRGKLETKIERLTANEIKRLLKFFGQEHDGIKEELVERLADFLEKPKASDVIYEDKKRKRSTSRSRSRSRSTSRSSSRKSRSKSPAKKKKKDPNAPKRPLSSYVLFCQDMRSDVVKKHPKLDAPGVLKKLGELWHECDKADKKKYQAKADKEKEKYEKAMEKYNKEKGSPKKKSSPKKKAKSEEKEESESSSSESDS